jgi:hypothetical protein
MTQIAKSKVTPKEKLERLLTTKTTVSPHELHEAAEDQLGGLNSIYLACARGDYDNFRSGKLIKIVTASLRRKLGIEA